MRLRIVLASAPITAAIIIGTTTAHADPIPVQRTVIAPNSGVHATVRCDDFCAWARPNFRGLSYDFPPGRHTCWILHPNIRSAENHTGHTVHFFRYHRCSGSTFAIRNGYHTARTPWPVGAIAVY
ncbi:hypothetical protein GCM10029978_066380 [Actinoallomurus acanthiterrae]